MHQSTIHHSMAATVIMKIIHLAIIHEEIQEHELLQVHLAES